MPTSEQRTKAYTTYNRQQLLPICYRLEEQRDRALEAVDRVREYAERCKGSANTAYAKAGRHLLEIIAPYLPPSENDGGGE